MNILILQGSPRANGNTAWMAEEYNDIGAEGRVTPVKMELQAGFGKIALPPHFIVCVTLGM
jgi:hypothetical protein